MYLFVLQRASRVLFCFGQPEQSFLLVFHGHVGLPEHEQVFTVEVWIDCGKTQTFVLAECILNLWTFEIIYEKNLSCSQQGIYSLVVGAFVTLISMLCVLPSSAFRKNSKAWKKSRKALTLSKHLKMFLKHPSQSFSSLNSQTHLIICGRRWWCKN